MKRFQCYIVPAIFEFTESDHDQSSFVVNIITIILIELLNVKYDFCDYTVYNKYKSRQGGLEASNQPMKEKTIKVATTRDT